MGGGEGLDSRPGAGVGLGSEVDRVGTLGCEARWWPALSCRSLFGQRGGRGRDAWAAALVPLGLRHPSRLAGLAARGRPGGFSFGGSGPVAGGAASEPSPFERILGARVRSGGRPCSDVVSRRPPLGAGDQAESLILAQNERWRRA